MASCYGPTSVSTCPLLVFKRAAYAGEDGGFRGACGSEWSLVATGSLANVEPDRIMLKKVRVDHLHNSGDMSGVVAIFSNYSRCFV
jgi:hypothetical protein